MNIIQAKPGQAEELARLALRECDAEREQLRRVPAPPFGAPPALPPSPDAAALAQPLAELLDSPYAFAAMEDGACVGYLAFEGPWDGFFGNASGVWSPLHGCAAVGPRRARVLEALLTRALARLAADGVSSVALSRFAHDEDARDALLYGGFGVRCADAIRPLGPDAYGATTADPSAAYSAAIADKSAAHSAATADATATHGTASPDPSAAYGAAAADPSADGAAASPHSASQRDADSQPSAAQGSLPMQLLTDALAASAAALLGHAADLSAPREATPREPTPPDGVAFRELTWRGADVLLPLKNGLCAHLCESPTFFPSPAYTRESFAALCERRRSRFLVAYDGERPLAYIELGGGGENYLTDQPGVINICGMYALPEARGLGVAGRLADMAAEAARASGAGCLGVDCETLNLAARHFWAKRFTSYTYSYHRRLDERAVRRV